MVIRTHAGPAPCLFSGQRTFAFGPAHGYIKIWNAEVMRQCTVL